MVKIVQGITKSREDKARLLWSIIKTKEAWDAQTNAVKLEAVRQFMVYFLKKEFRELDE